MFPVAQNEILVRFENLGDALDNQAQTIAQIDILNFATALYSEVNEEVQPSSVQVQEMFLQGTYPKEQSHFKW